MPSQRVTGRLAISTQASAVVASAAFVRAGDEDFIDGFGGAADGIGWLGIASAVGGFGAAFGFWSRFC